MKKFGTAMARRNPHIGTNFDDFLKDEGIFEEVQSKTLERAMADQIESSNKSASASEAEGRNHPGLSGNL